MTDDLQKRETMTRVPRRHLLRLERFIATVLVVVPPLGTLIAVPWIWRHGLSTVDVLTFWVMYVSTVLGITVGYHRLLTHRSFDCPRWLTAGLAIAGSMALQGPIIRWVADHRRHHLAPDTSADPHSPHVDHDGPLRHASGLWHAHIGWFFDERKTRASRFAKDLLSDSLVRRLDRLYLVWALASVGIPLIVGWVASGFRLDGAISGLLVGGFCRIFVMHHVTWSINSICHSIGERPFDTTDASRDNAWLALLSLGESWHNHHHAFPAAAIYPDLRAYQVDLSGRFIGALERLGIATNVKRPTAGQIARKRSPSRNAVVESG